MINSSKTFRFTFTPIDGYFFGGENSFANGADTYFSRSNIIPQQTAVLGALRYYLLVSGSILRDGTIGNDEEAQALIGKESYQVGKPWTESGLGVIQAISPIFFSSGKQLFRIADNVRTYTLIECAGSTKIAWNPTLRQEGGAVLAGYNHKSNHDKGLFDAACNFIKLDELLRRGNKVGITKVVGPRKDQNGFYRQEHIHLVDNWRFAFDAKLTMEYTFKAGGEVVVKPLVLKDAIITMGADRSAFHVQSQEISMETLDYSNVFSAPATNFPALILLSDGILPESIYRKTLYAIGESVSFRQLYSTTSKSVDYHRLPSNSRTGQSAPSRSGLSYALRAGSILYFKNADLRDEAADWLFSSDARHVGYNHYLKTPIN